MRKHISEPWFSLVASSVKTVEGRLNKGDFATISVGDRVTWFNGSREVTTFVVGKAVYDSFERMLRGETLTRTLPPVKTVQQGVAVYREFYSAADEQRYGVLALRLQAQVIDKHKQPRGQGTKRG